MQDRTRMCAVTALIAAGRTDKGNGLRIDTKRKQKIKKNTSRRRRITSTPPENNKQIINLFAFLIGPWLRPFGLARDAPPPAAANGESPPRLPTGHYVAPLGNPWVWAFARCEMGPEGREQESPPRKPALANHAYIRGGEPRAPAILVMVVPRTPAREKLQRAGRGTAAPTAHRE